MSAPARPAPGQLWLVWLGVSAVVLALLLTTAGAIGVTWDEPIYSQAAENAARWFGTLLQGGPAAAFEQTAFGVGWGLVNEHPPLVRVLNGLGWAVTRGFLPAPTAHRVGSMLLAALTIGVLAAATARRSGVAAGLFAAAAALTMPRVFFHVHLGALDFAHAATWFLATLAFYYAASSRRWWAPLLAGLGLGLALLTKINAVLLVPYWGIWLLLYRRREAHAWLVLPAQLARGAACPDRGLAMDLGRSGRRAGELGQVLPRPFRDSPVVRRQALRKDALVSCPRDGGHHDAGGASGAGDHRSFSNRKCSKTIIARPLSLSKGASFDKLRTSG